MTAAVQAQIPPAYTYYVQGLVDELTFDAVVRLVQRETLTTLSRATAVVLSAEELIVSRDAQGTVQGAHGFSFANVGGHRLISASFSVVDESVSNRRSQFGQVVMRVLGTERARHPGTSVIWSHAPECDAELARCAARVRPMRMLISGSGSPFLEGQRFYTDQFASGDELVSVLIEKTVVSIRKRRYALEIAVNARLLGAEPTPQRLAA